MTSCQCQGIEKLFGERIARRDLRRYRKKGPLKTTRILLDALTAEGVAGATLLDIGGGVGAVSNGLIEAGISRATVVDASPAYIETAEREAERQGHRERIDYQFGDFVETAPRLEAADIVTLDRVICCYNDMEALVAASAGKATRLYGLVFPRDIWWERVGVSVANFACWVRRNPFRAYVHDPQAVERVVKSQGLSRRFYRATSLWQVLVYAR